MNKTISVSVKNKIAAPTNDVLYICGNSDFVIDFDFDAEWDEFDTKTARFIYNGIFQDIVFEGNQCAVPIISDAYNIKVGVFAGNLRTTTPAIISAKKSILCGIGSPAAPSDDVYNQIMELIQGLGEPSPEDIEAAIEEYFKQNPITESDPTVHEWAKAEKKPTYTAKEVGAVATEELPQAINTALEQAKASGAFDGADGQDGKDGKDGYTPVKGVDYFDGEDGRPGPQGNPGPQGPQGSPGIKGVSVVGVTYAGTDNNGYRYNLNLDNGTFTTFVAPYGPKGDTGETGPVGPAYTLTDADKQDMVNDVLSALPTWEGGSF